MGNDDKEMGNDDKEIDLLELMKASKGKDWQPLTEANWKDEIKKVPLFMTELPTEEEMGNNPTLQAIQSLVYDGPSEEMGENFKAQGDEIVKNKLRKNYSDAVEFYTKALVNCERMSHEFKLRVLLNRAAVHLELENYRSAMIDCVRVIRDESVVEHLHLKALFRCAKACIGSFKFDQAEECIKIGLLSKDKNFFEGLEKQLSIKKEAVRMEEKKRELMAQEKFKRANDLFRQINILGLKFSGGLSDIKKTSLYQKLISGTSTTDCSGYDYFEQLFPLPNEVYDSPIVERNGSIAWPCLLIYPQLSTFDYIKSWNSVDVTINDQLENVLGDVRFDLQTNSFQYHPTNASCFYPVRFKDKLRWQRINVSFTITRMLKLPNIEIPLDGVLRLWIVPDLETKEGDWTRDWMKTFQ